MRDRLPRAWTPSPRLSQPSRDVWWDENKPIGEILGPNGKVIKKVMPKRRPIGFRHPNCKE